MTQETVVETFPQVDTLEKDSFAFDPTLTTPEGGEKPADAENKTPEASATSDPEKKTGKEPEEEEKTTPADDEKKADKEKSGDGETPPEPPEDEGKKKKDPVQERINKITRKRYEAERERDYYKAELERLKAEAQKPKEAPAETTSEKPKEEDFENYSDFVEALADWKAEQKAAQIERKLKEEREQAQKQSAQQEFVAKLEQGREKYSDFDEVVFDPDVPITQPMVEALHDCEHAADIAYYLGKHPDVAGHIASLSPLAAAREIGIIEAELSKPKAPPAKKVTQAPEPINPSGGGVVVEKDPAKMTNAEYRRWRQGKG